MEKSKGFTLVELLAVIVILAVLVLVATPAVTSIMQRSQQNSFKNEVLGMIKEFNTAYTDKSGRKITTIPSTTTALSAEQAKSMQVFNVTTEYDSVAGSYKYFCMTVQDLVNEQYIKKDISAYDGYFQMWVPNKGEPIVFMNVTNSAYYLQGRESVVNKDEHIPSQDPFVGTGIGTPNPDSPIGCPKLFTIPGSYVVNGYSEDIRDLPTVLK